MFRRELNMSQLSSRYVPHSLIGGYTGEREDTGVGVHERTYLKNGETYHVNNMRHSIRGRICAVMGGQKVTFGPSAVPDGYVESW
jgi:hypothetical protein